MRAERMTGLARLAIQLAGNFDLTAAAQWLERTLDDSANKRIALPELFLSVDSLLILYHDVAGGLEVGPILMGMGNTGHIVTPSITARGLLNIAALAGGTVASYG